MPPPKDPEKYALWKERQRQARANRVYVPLSEEKRRLKGERISAAKLGKPRPDMRGDNNPMRRPEIAAKMGDFHKGRPKSPEQKAKIAETLRGRTLPPEHRAKLVKEIPGYKGAHWRIKKLRGRASTHRCVCGEPATDWCLIKERVTALITDKQGRTYSLDPNDYEPMCHPCHMLHDDTAFAKH